MSNPPDLASLVDLLRRSLTTIGQRLEAIEKVASDYVDAANAANKAEREKKHTATKVEVRLEEETEKKRSTEQKRAQGTQNFIAGVAAVTALAAIVYAGIATWQVIVTRRQLKATIEFFQRDQRPYVSSTKIDSPVFAPPDNRLALHLWYHNTGKSPALHMQHEGWIFYGDSAMGEANTWFKSLGNEGLPKSNPFFGEGFLMQGENPTEVIVTGRSTASGLNIQFVVGMRIQYFDAFNNRYWTDICYWHLPDMDPTISTHCPTHNEMYEGKK